MVYTIRYLIYLGLDKRFIAYKNKATTPKKPDTKPIL
jgi:hypothetical protein